MPRGTLEVLLVSAKGLENTDMFGNMDPYVILTCRSQEKKSSVAQAQGTEPRWNETFLFSIGDGVSDLRLRIMDKDTLTTDDFVGEAIIQLDPLFVKGSVPVTAYNVVKGKTFHGEIRVGLTFRSEHRDRDYSSGGGDYSDGDDPDQSYGGWKESSY